MGGQATPLLVKPRVGPRPSCLGAPHAAVHDGAGGGWRGRGRGQAWQGRRARGHERVAEKSAPPTGARVAAKLSAAHLAQGLCHVVTRNRVPVVNLQRS